MDYLKKLLLLIVIITVILCCNNAYALYQFDDVSGTSGIGAQWVGFLNYSPILAPLPIINPNSVGGPTTLRMQTTADLVYNNNSVYYYGHGDDVRPLHTLYLVIPEGVGTLASNFRYDGSLPAVTLGIYGGNFETSYSSIINYPTPGAGPSVNVDLTVQKRAAERTVYDSHFGELIFHQNPTTVPSQTLHIPFVIANVHDGTAQYAPLEIKVTTRNTSGDVVGRRWFNWDVLSDKTVPSDPVDWIFVPITDQVIDRNEFEYRFTTEVTNHTGLRYGIQRYDDNRTIMPAHWKFDLKPISGRLPKILHLQPLSHIVPGLVTIYSHDAKVTVGQQNLLRLAAVDTTGEIIGSKRLQLRYRTVYGYELGSVQDTTEWTNRNSFWGINAFRVYQSNRNFFTNTLKAMEIKNADYFFPSRSSNILQGNVENTFPPITADALSSFTLSAPVPLERVVVISKDAGGNDVWVSSDVYPKNGSAMLGANIILRIPKANRFVTEHWEDFAASKNLANDFARYFSVWFRSPSGIDLDLSKYLKEESKYERVMKVFIDEENECLIINYVTLLIEEGNSGSVRRPKIRIVSDVTSVNDYDYIVVNDGLDNGKWELVFYVAPAGDGKKSEDVKPKPVQEGDSVGCSTLFIPFLLIAALLLLPFKRKTKIISLSVLLIFAFSLTSFAAPSIYEVVYDSDASVQGSLRYAIQSANSAGGTEPGIVLINNLVQISITSPIELTADMEIEGNGALISGNGAFRLFRVTNGAKVNFRNMTFTNGNASNDVGGAVFIDGQCSVSFDKCTFTQNKASGNGGAVYSGGRSHFTNCTFFENSSGGSGGAVFGGMYSTLSFLFVTMNSNQCNAQNGGHAVNASGIENTFQASIFAGNGNGGNEVICSIMSRSLGYNVFTDSSFQATDHETDLFGKPAAGIFGSVPVIRRNDAAPRWRNWPYTLALANVSTNPAMAIIPISLINSWGVLVDQRFISRLANRPASAGAYEIYSPEAPITSLVIGGVPNGIATAGFTAQLRAYVLPESGTPGVIWSSSDPSVIAVTPYGRVYTVGSGISLLTATSTGYDSSGKQLTDSVFVKVGDGRANFNIPPELENMINTLNAGLAIQGVQFYVSDSRKYFSDTESFRKAYGNDPLVINPLPEAPSSTVSSNYSINSVNAGSSAAGKNTLIKPSVRFVIKTDSTKVGIVPFILSVSLSAKEISDIMGNSVFSAKEFFKKATICTGVNAENTLIDDGTKGINVKNAEDSGFLSVRKGSSGNVNFILNGWIADTKETSVIDGQLILSDGKSDGIIDCEIWFTALSESTNNKNPQEESSGGCNSWIGWIVLFTLIPLLWRSAKKVLMSSLFFLFILTSANMAHGASFSVQLDHTILRLVFDQAAFILTATTNPTDSGGAFVYQWRAQAPGVVSITGAQSSQAQIQGLNKGSTVIECNVTSGDETVTAYCEVIVYGAGMRDVFLFPNPNPLVLYFGFVEQGHITPNYQPSTAEPVTFDWRSSNPDIADVNHSGDVTIGRSKGESTITHYGTAVPPGGGDSINFEVSYVVKVLRPLISIDITENTTPVTIGGQGDIVIAFFPEDADSKDIRWSTVPSSTSISGISPNPITPTKSPETVTFSANGFPGPYTIPKTYPNPVIVTASSVFWRDFMSFVSDDICEIVIDPIPITEVRVTPELIIAQSVSEQLAVTIVPSNATKTNDSWHSENPLFASVSQSGLVTGVREGNANIVYSFNGWVINYDGTHSPVYKYASSYVIITSPDPDIRVSGIQIIEPGDYKLRIQKGASFQILAEVIPTNAKNKTVYWASNNLLVASVNTNGFVTALNPGLATITVVPADKGVDGAISPISCDVTVYDSAEINNPATVKIPVALQNKIEQMNSPLKFEGLEVNFGFLLEKPEDSYLMSYGLYPHIISELDSSANVKIYLGNPISHDNDMQPVMASARFEVNVESDWLFGQTPILPVSLKMMITKETLSKYLPQYSAEELIKNPRQYLSQLFSTFVFQKQIVDVPEVDAPNAIIKLVPLFSSPAAALEAERLGIIQLKGIGDRLEVTLNYYIADSNNTEAKILGKSLIIGDGTANGIIRDPIWIVVKELNSDTTKPKPDSDDGDSGGCSSIGLNLGGFIVIIALCFAFYRNKLCWRNKE